MAKIDIVKKPARVLPKQAPAKPSDNAVDMSTEITKLRGTAHDWNRLKELASSALASYERDRRPLDEPTARTLRPPAPGER